MRSITLLALALPLIAALPLDEAVPVQNKEMRWTPSKGELGETIWNGLAGETGGSKPDITYWGPQANTDGSKGKGLPEEMDGTKRPEPVGENGSKPPMPPRPATADMPPPDAEVDNGDELACPGGDDGKPDEDLKPRPSSTPKLARPQPAGGATGNGTGSTPGPVPENAKAGLAKVNDLRALHSAPSLTWDKGLEKMAQDWVNLCKFAHGGTERGTGQNIYASSIELGPEDDYLSEPTQSWYSEEPQYASTGYGEPRQLGVAGHFTQLVWEGTTKVGCARNTVACPKNQWRTIVVCNYKEAGNLAGAYEKNVLPPSTSPKSS
ncbi:cysteine-rich secretory protein family protein [Hirsutella rhossiliensis]|uniref:Cysteine-rich secretory protein family domain-containing protein n=1 Tax=Hirsutella rhossiliensis TaxID=111463 RepID=A0A9P8MV58_9HYPO|nr:cysteine-rich secretory protein family domain-containing protein [Hirsutella rhossiliensis]KAH0961815.1 cysteine-rich secretory protein family domain-containing protein [Hirsutella rhossiliensis]